MKTLLMLAAAAAATPAPKAALAPSEIVAAAPKGDWVSIPASDLLVMDLASGKRVVIQLMPPPFSGRWVDNIRKLAAAHWWDGTSINRVQDNYVVQWGDVNAEDKAKAKQLPPGLAKVPESEYGVGSEATATAMIDWAKAHGFSASEPGRQVQDLERQIDVAGTAADAGEPLKTGDAYANIKTYLAGWPIAGITGPDAVTNLWPVHCYGMVGVGRGMPPDTGTGAELYTVIGHAPRHLDRNIALVGRVISGIEHLSSMPRGTGPLGFYEKPEQRVGITSVRLGTEVKDLAQFEYLSTESASFATYADARANRRDPFFIQPAGGADICNIPVPVRVAK